MKVLCLALAACLCLQAAFSQESPPAKAGLSAPPPPIGRQPTPKETCEACRQTIASCQGYNFRTVVDLTDTKTWVDCMQDSFKKWRNTTGSDYWPKSEELISGTVGVADDKPDRVQCFAHVARSPTLPCVPCALFHREATSDLDKDSKECWRQINKEKSTKEVKEVEEEAKPAEEIVLKEEE